MNARPVAYGFMMHAGWLALALFIMTALGSAGCAAPAKQEGGSQTPPPEEIRIGVGDDVPLFSALTTAGGNSSLLTRDIYESLVSPDTNLKPIPGLAESWKVSADGKSYEFKLRKGATYVNGDPVVIEDVAFVFANAKDPKRNTNLVPQKHWLRAEIVDRETVRYVLDWPDPGFLRSLGDSFRHHLVPQKYYESIGGEDAFEKAPIGSGPYKVVERKVKEGWTLERYEGYWGNKPLFKRAVFKVIPEPSTRSAALKVGEIDFSNNFPPSFMADAEKDGFKLLKNPSSNTVSIRINKLRETDPATGKPNPFRDKRVRQAMAYAIDRDAIISRVLSGIGEPVAIQFPEDFGYDPELKPFPYDPNKAKQLLADAGYKDGIDATFYGLLGERVPLSKEVGEVVAQYLTAVGIRTKVVNEEYAAWLARTVRGSSQGKPNELYPLGYGFTYVGGGATPYQAFRELRCEDMNTKWTCDPEFDKVHDQLMTESDPKKAEEITRALARRAHEEQYLTVLYRNVTIYAMRNQVQFTPTVQSQYVELKNMGWK